MTLHDIAENWYARLNNLKAYADRDDISLDKRQQCERLIWIMIERMMRLTPHYLEMMHKRFKPNKGFPVGGVSFSGDPYNKPSK